MAWCNESTSLIQIIEAPSKSSVNVTTKVINNTCPSCGHTIEFQHQRGIQDLPGLPAGVKFDPSDQEIVEHLNAKVFSDNNNNKLIHHPLIDEFIPTIDGENGICYTHPEKLPGVRKDGQVRHFFHRPSKAYTTGNRKRRKVHTESDNNGGETRWHKTGKTRPVYINNGTLLKGYKKILVLYTNYGRQKKPEKTNWVMHQYHLGDSEEEKDGELVVSKVFYQTQPRQCGLKLQQVPFNNKSSSSSRSIIRSQDHHHSSPIIKTPNFIDYYNPPPFMSYQNNSDTSSQLIPNLVVHDNTSSILNVPSNASKE